MPGLVRRPLAILRCPEGIAGEQFFQRHAHHGMPDGVREGTAGGAPYMAIDDFHGLMRWCRCRPSSFGRRETDPLHPDQLVFDPGEGVAFTDVTAAALHLRQTLAGIGLAAFCRTTGGKGLHLVVPLKPDADWDTTRAFCKRFAEYLSAQRPERYLSTVRKADRRGRILIDWLRNGLGSTAVASFCARRGTGVATPLAWDEVRPSLDPADLTIGTVPDPLAALRTDPWNGFEAARRTLPSVAEKPARSKKEPSGSARIVTAPPPRRKR